MSATIRSKSLATKKSFTISSAENQSLTLGCTSFEEFWPKLTDPSIPPAKKPKKMFKDCSCVLDAWKSTPNRTITNEWILNDFLKDWDFPTGLIIYHFVLEYFLPKSFCFSLMRGQSISLPLAELDRERFFNTFLTLVTLFQMTSLNAWKSSKKENPSRMPSRVGVQLKDVTRYSYFCTEKCVVPPIVSLLCNTWRFKFCNPKQ